MSRIIDFDNVLDADEEQYVKDRPWMIRDAELAGQTVRFESEGPFDDETEEEGESAEDYSDTKVWVKKTLQAEIDSRNEERDEDDLIIPDGTTRDDLVEALLLDDEAQAEAEAENGEEGETEDEAGNS